MPSWYDMLFLVDDSSKSAGQSISVAKLADAILDMNDIMDEYL